MRVSVSLRGGDTIDLDVVENTLERGGWLVQIEGQTVADFVAPKGLRDRLRLAACGLEAFEQKQKGMGWETRWSI